MSKRTRIAWILTIGVRMFTATVLATAAPETSADHIPVIEQFDAPRSVALDGGVFHAQGVELDDLFLYATSVDAASGRGYLHKFTRDGALLRSVELTDGPRSHPGGFSRDGAFLWIPVAEYRRHGTTRIVQVDRDTLRTVRSFLVADHIGALAAGEGRLTGANWDAAHFYVWDQNGRVLANVPNPTRAAYQDLKFEEGLLVASGVMPGGQAGTVDWLDPETFKPLRRLAVGKTPAGDLWSREGMTLAGGRIYFLPEDGRGARVYSFDLERLLAASGEATASPAHH